MKLSKEDKPDPEKTKLLSTKSIKKWLCKDLANKEMIDAIQKEFIEFSPEFGRHNKPTSSNDPDLLKEIDSLRKPYNGHNTFHILNEKIANKKEALNAAISNSISDSGKFLKNLYS